MEEPATDAAPSEPVQKRKVGKRTARACDECRMRKSKCDGLQPCEACQTTDRYCTYNLSAGRSTGSGTRIRILEDRLRRARAYLNEAQRRTPSLAHVNFDALLGPMDEYARSEAKLPEDPENDQSQEVIPSMMDSYGQMTVSNDDGMEHDFYGAASGYAWIQRARDCLNDETDSESDGSGDDNDNNTNNSATVQLFDAPLPPKHALSIDVPGPQLLPPQETTTKLLRIVFTQVYPMFHFLDVEDFEASTDRIYSRNPTEYTESDQTFLTLLYLVVGLGYLFSQEEHGEYGCRQCLTEGMRHFIAARSVIDIAHLRNLVALQSIISLILFLMSTARVASAHAFLGAACASAMRQGLHYRSTHEASMSDSERRVRRRVFWAVVNLDMFISSILGLPPFMDMSAVDPAIDTTIEHSLTEAKNTDSQSADDKLALESSARHIELMRIVYKAQRALFPKPTDPPYVQHRNGKIMVSVVKLQQVEKQLRDWAKSLTHILSHPSKSVEAMSIKYEMRACYYYAHIILYRAFLHCLAKKSDGDVGSPKSIDYAQTCVKHAAKVVELSVEHQRAGLLCPASWSSVYAVFMSMVCLIFSYATREQYPSPDNVKQDIENGIRLLASTACTTDTGSVRCLEILRRLIKRVSYTVDIDLDQICADTKPCCLSKFPLESQSTIMMDFGESRLYDRSSEETGGSTSGSSWMPPVSSSQQFTITPDAAVSQASVLDYSFAPQIPEQQAHFGNADEMIEIPYGGQFQWEDGDDTMGLAGGQSPLSEPLHQAQKSEILNQVQRRLTAEDIAAFMHSNQVDEPYRRRPAT